MIQWLRHGAFYMPYRPSAHVLTSIASVALIRCLGRKICFDRHNGERKPPPSSYPKLSLSLKRRFAALEREEVDQYSIVKVPKCTEQSNNWAASNYEEWQRDYNRRNPGGSTDCQELDEVQTTFIVETRKGMGRNILHIRLISFSKDCTATSPRRGLTSILLSFY